MQKIIKMKKKKTIEWGWEKQKPINIRSKKHQKFLIKTYNKNRPISECVNDMAELNRALLTNEIKALND